MRQQQTKAGDDMIVNESAAKFDRIRRAHQSEVAEDYVEMISDLIAETGEARTVDLAARVARTAASTDAASVLESTFSSLGLSGGGGGCGGLRSW